MNRHAIQVLQFPAVLDRVAGHATSELGAAAVRALVPSDSRAVVAEELARMDAALAFVVRTDGWAVPVIPDLRDELRRLSKSGSVLDGRALLDAVKLIRSSAAAREAVARHREEIPGLAYLLDRLVDRTDRADRLDRALDDTGEIRDDASPALNRIRRELRSSRSTIVERMERYAASLPDSYRVEDASVSVREGRYVIPVRREGRSHVGGIVHDESATGGTLFVEPPLALDLMNRVRELELAETREVQRILEELTETLRPHAAELRAALDALIELDSLYARARYALAHDATPPSLSDDDRDYRVIHGRHPLLLETEREVVPFDLMLEPEERTMVVSGPNTGGKTVLLKTLGLISLMVQAGVVPPVGKGTRVPVFSDVFADIGDEQSIEASLSTFSAHLANLREIVAESDHASLVLIDEIGSGTDPSDGAALAQSILVELNRRGTLTVATSHLGQLKLLAGEEAGVVNASLQFDSKALAPTYRLIKGVPGRSYGLAIARRLGFPEPVLERAEALLPRGERDVSQLLTELEEKEQELLDATNRAERERVAAAEARADADRLRAELDERRREVRRREDTAEQRARQQARDLLLNARQDVESAIAELRSAVEKGTAGQAFEEAATAARRRVEEAARRQAERAPPRRAPERERQPPPELEPGSAVRISATGARGTVVEVREGRATVEASGLRLDVKIDDLEAAAPDPEPRKSEARRSRGGWSGPTVDASPEVHLRGLRAEEVQATLIPALDAAIQAGLPSLKIVHGKGGGVLREVVAELLDRDPRVSEHRPGRIGEGGSGVTVAELG